MPTIKSFSLQLQLLSLELVLIAVGANPTPAQIVVINEPRPLAKTALLWELHSGVPISYEDAPYAYAGDLVDETAPEFKKNHPTISTFSLRSGALTLEIAVPKRSVDLSIDFATVTPVVAAGLQKAINDHTLKGNPGKFKLSQTAEGLVILPSSVADRTGAPVPVTSPLDMVIKFPTQLRDGFSTLLIICQSINSAAGKDLVTPGTVPPNLQSQQALIGADNEVARNVLVRALAGLQWSDSRNVGKLYKMSWRLLYGPDTNVQKYALNVHTVEMEAQSPNGSVVKVPVTR